MKLILVMIAVICAIGWILNCIMARAAITYILEKGWPVPTREEWKRCAEVVIQEMKDNWSV